MTRRPVLTAVFMCIGLFAVGSFSFVYWQESKPLPRGDGIEYPSQAMPKATREQFLQGDFSIILKVKALPGPVLRAFTEEGGSRLLMVDPGKKFEATDAITDAALPSERLIFAGVSGDRCFVHYEQGGFRHSYVLALFNVNSTDTMKPVWRGYCRAGAANLAQLRARLVNGDCSQR
jgi:hypothetical protein